MLPGPGEGATEGHSGWYSGPRPTKASTSIAHGTGLTAASVRQFGVFTIEAHDDRGERQQQGGDAFSVVIRGRGERVRARVIDNSDGTYTVGYKASSSGRYTISIALDGEPLRGSPFACTVSTLTPCASMCRLQGKALSHAIAREQSSFEVRFCDALGQVAHAEELEVYVEPVVEGAHDEAGATERSSAAEPATAPAGASGGAGQAMAAVSAEEHGGAERQATDGSERRVSVEADNCGSAAAHSSVGLSREASQQVASGGDFVVIGPRPLVVRETQSRGSLKLCQLSVGSAVRLLKVVVAAAADGGGAATAPAAAAMPTGGVSACTSVVDGANDPGGGEVRALIALVPDHPPLMLPGGLGGGASARSSARSTARSNARSNARPSSTAAMRSAAGLCVDPSDGWAGTGTPGSTAGGGSGLRLFSRGGGDLELSGAESHAPSSFVHRPFYWSQSASPQAAAIELASPLASARSGVWGGGATPRSAAASPLNTPGRTSARGPQPTATPYVYGPPQCGSGGGGGASAMAGGGALSARGPRRPLSARAWSAAPVSARASAPTAAVAGGGMAARGVLPTSQRGYTCGYGAEGSAGGAIVGGSTVAGRAGSGRPGSPRASSSQSNSQQHARGPCCSPRAAAPSARGPSPLRAPARRGGASGVEATPAKAAAFVAATSEEQPATLEPRRAELDTHAHGPGGAHAHGAGGGALLTGGGGDANAELAPIGWVTIKRDGRELVAPRTRLPHALRQQQQSAWRRRAASDGQLAKISAELKSKGGEEADASKGKGKNAKQCTAADRTVGASPPPPPPPPPAWHQHMWHREESCVAVRQIRSDVWCGASGLSRGAPQGRADEQARAEHV